MMIKGSCMCGAVEYEIELMPEQIYNCHCSKCRKAHGAAFATQALAKGDTLKILKGKEMLKEYTGGKGVRAFCSHCGSRMMNYAPDKSMYLSVALSNVDTEIKVGPVAHVNVESKALWHEPSADIPAFQGLPDGMSD